LEEMMKHYTFYREDNNFTDILNDVSIKKLIDEKIRWYQWLTIGIADTTKNSQSFSLLTLKYGDDMKQDFIKDFSPVPGVDYIPKKDASKYKKSIS
jgi:hypothetical protein